jgi:glutathione synthase/RimK-type ligase-like ATP-grasp enzyme
VPPTAPDSGPAPEVPQVPLVLLATSRDWPEGEPGHEVLDAALEAQGITVRWVRWDDPDVDWRAAELVAVRSTWDYDGRLEEFLAWAGRVGPALLNGAAVFRWNTDKRYLLDLGAAGVPVVPTVDADTPEAVRAAVADVVGVAAAAGAVVKPRVGAGGRGVSVVAPGRPWEPAAGAAGPWIVQPLVESIRDEGETSVFVLDGRPVSQVRKVPGPGEVRVHEQYGGSSRPVPLADEAARIAMRAVAAVADLLGADIAYARADLMRLHGRLVVSEVELTEPGLYLDVLPVNGTAFADAVAARVLPRTW